MDHIFEENVCKFDNKDVILGIDEAGRGPVLGPMVYACLYYPKENENLLKNINVDGKEINFIKLEKYQIKLNSYNSDSKKLTSVNRNKINNKIRTLNDKFGWRIHIISPEYLSYEMLRKQKRNLNEISYMATTNLIRSVLNNGVNVKQIYVDTVGPPESYTNRLKSLFPSISITVKPKADSLFPSVSAASILAKVKRDIFLLNWWDQPNIDKFDIKGNDISLYEQGSGYPGDPKTKEFLKLTFDPIFGFPNIVRFSWSTANDIIEKNGYAVNWGTASFQIDNEKKISKTRDDCKFIIKILI